MKHPRSHHHLLAGIALLALLAGTSFAQPAATNSERREPRSRRTQRVVPMQEIRITSPDESVALVILPNAERLTFTVTLGNTTVIEPSPISMQVDGYDLSAGVIFNGLERYEMNETFAWHGVHSTALNRCRGARIAYTNDLSMAPYTLDVRVFNDGVAFRHIVPGEDGASRVPDEYTTFIVPAGSTVWYHNLDGHYEAPYVKHDIADVPAGDWSGPPLTFQLPGNAGYASIAEANLVNYSGLALEADGRRGWITGLGHRQPVNYPFELRYGREEAKRLGAPAAVTGTITTPWRVVKVARDLNALVNSDVLPALCPPADPKYFPAGMNTDWVEPGLAVWRYVDGGDNTFEGMMEFSRLGGLLGAKYHIIEGMWRRWSDEQVREIVAYSKERGVRLVFWKHSRDLRTPELREEFFSKLHALGVAGAKIDFFDHEAKELVDLYEALMEKAAEYKMVLDFHGANKPTGRMRTWPNAMIHEAVRGMESSNMKERARHETILPFTRYLAGGADYTTMHFGVRRGDTTWAHQIASLATFDSAMLTIAAHPQTVLDHPAADVIKSIPAVWDETIVLPDSRIGELSIFARRKGDMWVLAVMSGPEAQTIRVPLSFLGAGRYNASYVRDDPAKDDAVTLGDATVQRSESLTVEMRPGGGFVGRFVKR